MADITLRGTAGSGGAAGALAAFNADGSPYIGDFTITGAGASTPQPPKPVVTALDDGAAFSFTGPWTTALGSTAFGGTEHYSDARDARASMTVEVGAAGSIRVLGTKDAHHGYAHVVLDSTGPAEVDCYAASRTPGALLWESSKLAAGKHTLEILVAGSHNDVATGSVVAIDKVEVADLVKVTPPTTPPPPTKGCAVGMVWFSYSPVPGLWSPVPPLMATNLAKLRLFHNQHMFRAFRSSTGDRGGALDWSGLSKATADIASCKPAGGFLTAYNAQTSLVGAADGDWVTQRVPTGAALATYARQVHDGVLMNINKGFTNLAVWNEMKGIWNDFKTYTTLYNAIWDAIKGDPATAMVKVYGPYCIFTNHQDNRWNGELHGAWGGVDPAVTNGVKYFLANARGIDGMAIDGSQGDIDGNSTNNYNPKRLTPEVQEDYWYDVAAWCRKTMDAIPAHKGKPLAALEAYWGNADRWPFVFRKFRDGGGNIFFIWHERDGVAGRIVNPDGSLTQLGHLIAAEQASGGAL